MVDCIIFYFFNKFCCISINSINSICAIPIFNILKASSKPLKTTISFSKCFYHFAPYSNNNYLMFYNINHIFLFLDSYEHLLVSYLKIIISKYIILSYLICIKNRLGKDRTSKILLKYILNMHIIIL